MAGKQQGNRKRRLTARIREAFGEALEARNEYERALGALEDVLGKEISFQDFDSVESSDDEEIRHYLQEWEGNASD